MSLTVTSKVSFARAAKGKVEMKARPAMKLAPAPSTMTRASGKTTPAPRPPSASAEPFCGFTRTRSASASWCCS